MQENMKYKRIKQNKMKFEFYVKLIDVEIIPFFFRFILALQALKFAAYKQTGYYYSNKLEKFFVNIAKKYDIKNYNDKYKSNTVLHVMTKAYNHGGHTRVVERWIENTKDLYENTVLLLNQGKNEIPSKLSDYTLKLDENSKIKKALKLRELAQYYEFIVLHTHMADPIATIAFGTEKFKRPILFFNHADHLFWIGKTIADMVLDIRTISSITKEYRNINDSVLCPIPCDFSNNKYLSRSEARSLLGIAEDEKIILTSGSSFKYTPIFSDSIFDSLKEILNKNKSVKLFAIGVEGDHWNDLKTLYGDRIRIFSTMPFEQYIQHISIADLIIDSYPFGGGTSLCDAMKAKIPVISLKPKDGSLDFIEKSQGICLNKQDFITKVTKALEDKDFINNLLQEELNLFEQECSIKNWTQNIIEIYNNAPKKHSLRPIENKNAQCFINEYTLAFERIYNNG